MENENATEAYGLLGYPLTHSFSARYFAEKFMREGIRATYRNLEFADAGEALSALAEMPGLRGFNVTIPHKQAVIPFLHKLSPEAAAIGAVNVVCVEHDTEGRLRLTGHNTDVTGFAESIEPLLNPELHRKALVLGTGGASKAVAFALKRMGIAPLYVSRHSGPNRTTYREISPEVIRTHRVIVNCTPVGMFPHTEECPELPYQLLTPAHLLYDLVYNPLETLFLRKGKAQGATVKNGLEMLHRQAEAAWRIWQQGGGREQEKESTSR